MTAFCLSAHPESRTNLLSPALLPARRRQSSFALVMTGDQLVGIFTERDLVKLAAASIQLESAKISDVMTSDVITLQAEANQDIFTARTYFLKHKIRHLPVLDGQRKLLGVITSESIRQALQPLYFMTLKRVEDVMVTEVLQAPATTSVRSLAQLMVEHQVSCVVITDAQAQKPISDALIRPVGIVTERDIVQFQTLGLVLDEMQASQVMSAPLIPLGPQDSLWSANQLMQQRYVERLVVTDAEGGLAGVLTQSNLLQLLEPVEMLEEIEALQKNQETQAAELRQANQQLQAEMSERLRLDAALRSANQALEKTVDLKTGELLDANSQLNTERRLAGEELRHQYERSQILSEMTLKIRQSLDLDDILKTAVAEVKQFLQADRVLIFKLQSEGFGTVVQEAVNAQWTKTLGYNMADPCLHEDFLEQYRQGRIGAIEDTDRANVQSCHTDFLKQFEVRANLVVPILQQNNLWGLLISHQCDRPRQWIETETELLRQVANQIGIALSQSQMLNHLEQQVEERTAELSFINIQLQQQIDDRLQAETLLRRSEAKYRALVETAQSIIWVINAEGRLFFINSAATQIYGYAPETMLGRRLFDDFNAPQSDTEAPAPPLKTLFSESTSVQFERTHVSKIGQPIHLLFNAIALKDAEGNISEITGTASDITDLKWEEAIQKIKSSVLDLMAQNKPMFEILLELVEQINHFLPSVDSTIMLLQADGQHLQSYIAPSMPPVYKQSINGLSIGPNVGSCGRAAYLKQRVIVEDIATDLAWENYREFILPYGFKACWSDPIKSADGRLLGTFGMYFREVRSPNPRELKLIEACSDLASIVITRKQADEALRTSEEQLRLTTDALPAFIAYIDNQQRYRFVNHAYEELFGVPREQIIGCHTSSFLSEDAYQQIRPYIEQAVSGHRLISETKVTIQGKDDFYLRGIYIPHINSEGAVNGLFFLGSDISQQKDVERMKNEFISVVSHELRTPLTSIYGSLKLLKTTTESSFSEDDLSMLNIAVSSSERLMRLINDILDLEKIESGKVLLEKQACDAAEMLSQAADSMTAQAQEQGITITTQLGSVTAWADPDHVHQALTNLLSNAIRFSPKGATIWLGAKENAHEILFSVKD